MIDIHSHLLPGIDDGARTLDEALALAHACVDDGIEHLVLTPHIYPGVYDNQRSGIEAAFVEFRSALAQARIPLELSFAGEVRLSPEVMPLIESDRVPFLGESEGYRNMLLELPDGQVPVGAAGFVRWLIANRIRPVIVHPERNKALMEHPQKLRSFIDAGCRIQVTAGSLVGQFGSRARTVAELMLESGWVDVVASDAHNLRARRPMMRAARDAIAKLCGREAALRLTRLAPAALCGVAPVSLDPDWQTA